MSKLNVALAFLALLCPPLGLEIVAKVYHRDHCITVGGDAPHPRFHKVCLRS